MGSLSGGVKCIKYLLFFFNFIFWLAGSAVLAVALWLRLDKRTTTVIEADGTQDTFFTGVYILIACGALMMLVGFCGCCGAIRESQCLLGTFFTCLLIVFAAEVATGVYGFLNKDEVVKAGRAAYDKLLEEHKHGKDNFTLAYVQNAYDCCEGGENINSINATCPNDGKNIHDDCKEKIEDHLNKKLYIIGIVGLGIAAVMIFGMIFSMVLCCAIRNSRDII